uniref:Uncharacterized protein n=1 Tax=Anopheles maculatus TaxID=74869 RepID=A0A182T1G2_9DIPT
MFRCWRACNPRPDPVGCDYPIYEALVPVRPLGAPVLPRRAPLPLPAGREWISSSDDESPERAVAVWNPTYEYLERCDAFRIENPAFHRMLLTRDDFIVQFAFVVVSIVDPTGRMEHGDHHEQVQGVHPYGASNATTLEQT